MQQPLNSRIILIKYWRKKGRELGEEEGEGEGGGGGGRGRGRGGGQVCMGAIGLYKHTCNINNGCLISCHFIRLRNADCNSAFVGS